MPNLQNQSLSESGQIVTTGDTGTITSAMIANNTVVDADINTGAAIALSKLASGTSAQIVLANTTGVPTYTALSGVVTITGAGLTALSTSANPTITGLTANSATGKIILSTDAGGSVSIGNTAGVTSTPYIDFHSGATAVDFDSRILASGGSGVSGGGTLTITSANTIITGDLTVSGNTTTLNTANLNVEDSFILLNSGVTGSPTLDSGLEVERGTSTNVFIRWNETTDKWQFTNDGSTYNDFGAGGATNSLTAPASPAAGSLWFKTDTAQTFVYYDSYWVEVGASGMAAMVSDTAPSSPIAGQIWFNSLNGGTYVYYSSAWTEIGAVPINALLNTIDAKGDLIAGTADNTVGRLAVGTNGFFLKANSSTSTGLEWASVPTINALDDVGDVTITSASSGQVLQWNGSAWINATVSSDVMTDAKNAALIIMDIGV